MFNNINTNKIKIDARYDLNKDRNITLDVITKSA